jgi:hypothetical protein
MSLFGPDSTWYKNKYGDVEGDKNRLKALTFPSAGNLRGLFRDTRSQLSPLYAGALLPGLMAGSTREAMMRGGVFDGDSVPASADTLALLNSYNVAGELMGLRTGAGQMLQGLQPAGGLGDIAEGAAAGFVAGGPIGGILGGLGGAISGKAKTRARSDQVKRAGRIVQEASPEQFGKNFAEAYPEAREVAMASGEGARRTQAIESAITASGLRGTGLGSLASVAAGVQTELVGLEAGLEAARSITEQRVNVLAGTPIQPRRDRIAEALETMANAYLGFSSARGQSNAPPVQGPPAPFHVGQNVGPG